MINNMKGYYIIIRGPLGSGKTTISKKLSVMLRAEYIGMDDVLKENKLDDIPPEAPCISAENFIKANETILPHIKGILEKGTPVIFDACFYHKEVIEHIIKNLPGFHYVFTLNVPLEICIERDSKRVKSYGSDAARAVHNLVSRFDYGIIIDASGNLEETLKEVLSYLPKKSNK